MAALTLIIFKTIKLVPFPGLKTILCISQKIPGPQIFYAGTENQFSLGIANPIRERFPFQHTGNLRIEREKYSYFYGSIIVTIQKCSVIERNHSCIITGKLPLNYSKFNIYNGIAPVISREYSR